MRRGARLAQPQADKIADTVAQSEIIGSDETSARVNGHNWWQWVFRSVAGVVHLIVSTREAEVIRQFMGANCAERWVSDCYSSQLLAPAKNRHLCLSHQIRDLERVIEQDPQLPWPVEMQDLFREGIHLWNRFTIEGEMTVDGNLRRVTKLENRLDDLMAEDQTGTAARKLYKRYVKHRSHLLYFLQQPGVPPTNNACESALRPSVIHRKVTDGFRSEWAAKGGGHPNLS